jgi:hypothetical protein
MLEEMSDPLFLRGFISGTTKDPKTDGHRADMGNLLTDNPQAVGKNLAMIHILSHPVLSVHSLAFSSISSLPYYLLTIFPEIQIIRDR